MAPLTAARIAMALGLASVVASTEERCFPENFLMGTATAAYQVEGGWNLTGRTPSIWDDFCRSRPEVQCANVADDFVHRYASDIAVMKEMGMSSFRFSISWSRVMKWDNATRQMERNQPGIDFYHALIDTLLASKMTPIATLYHFDLPSALHTQLNGWLNASIVEHFNLYADLMFDEYGSKVGYWGTFNEPFSFTTGGYANGNRAPGISHSDTAAFLAAHHVLLSHAAAVQTFRTKKLSSKISIVLNSDFAYPLDPNSPEDQEAAVRKLQFSLGWYLNPVVNGDYPEIMKKRAGSLLPQFTPEQSKLLKGSYDIFMLNHYSSNRVTDCDSPRSKTPCESLNQGWARTLGADYSHNPIGARTGHMNSQGKPLCSWFNGYPPGYLPMIRWMHAFNKSAPILLTENGFCGNATIDNQDQLWYYQGYLDQVWQGLQEGIPILGYTAWSFVDNYEWTSFEPRFGLFHVDFPPQAGSKEGYIPLSTDLKRTPRPAAIWFGQVVKSKCLPPVETSSKDAPAPSKSTSSGMYIGLGGLVLIVVVVIGAYVWRNSNQGDVNERTPLVAKD
ncbi:hypothetical protein Ae201684P_012573 [Aphanomyces euteiches]|uniref:Beta-glucosidase n=1 Tax=Aphanomyces euteiches TaxID=100861 RepID=A0A6G0WZE6_9STRA|nr:hypothetical protein Ae201684_010216 [Aphanomyces euteiches]KAH9076083.1 hypothetical protein Ae201684P_012573 [Aphanomyces euteiches]